MIIAGRVCLNTGTCGASFLRVRYVEIHTGFLGNEQYLRPVYQHTFVDSSNIKIFGTRLRMGAFCFIFGLLRQDHLSLLVL
mgnify:CR=1 FL=1